MTTKNTNEEIIKSLKQTISILKKKESSKKKPQIKRPRPNIMLTTGRLAEAIMFYRGMAYSELAERIGEHPMNFIKVLDGRRTLTDELAVKIGAALNVSPLVLIQSRIIEDVRKGKYDFVRQN